MALVNWPADILSEVPDPDADILPLDAFYAISIRDWWKWLSPRWSGMVRERIHKSAPGQPLIFAAPESGERIRREVLRLLARAWNEEFRRRGAVHRMPLIGFALGTAGTSGFPDRGDITHWNSLFHGLAPPVTVLVGDRDGDIIHPLGRITLRRTRRALFEEPIICADILRRYAKMEDPAWARDPSRLGDRNFHWSNRITSLLRCGLLLPAPADVPFKRAYYEAQDRPMDKRPLKFYLSAPHLVSQAWDWYLCVERGEE